MKNKQTRLSKLETQAIKLPPDGAYLASVYERLPENERDAWMRALTDDELMAMMQEHAKYGGLNIDRLTEDELKTLCQIDDDAKYYEWLGQLRAAKPHYFSEGER